jgi:hypothetical protein
MAEIIVQRIRKNKLDVKAAPTARDPNHANIYKWPPDKDDRMILCKELLIAAKCVHAK